jgi:tellurite resistance protein TehA-like permease
MFSDSAALTSIAKVQFLLSVIGWFLLALLGQIAEIEQDWGLALPSFCFGAGVMLYIIVVTVLFNGSKFDKGTPGLFLLFSPPAVAVTVLDNFNGDPTEFSQAAEFVLGWCLVVVLLLIRLGPTICMRPPVLGTYWAYVFPLSGLASAMIEYATKQKSTASEVMATVFLVVAALAKFIVLSRFIMHSYVVLRGRDEWGDPLIVQNKVVVTQEEHNGESGNTSGGKVRECMDMDPA